MELPMAALAADLKPAIILYKTKRFADFHSLCVAATLKLVKWTVC